jgi:excisionase family DNA binding protein
MPHPEAHHLELLSSPALAAAVGCSQFTLKRRALPRPITLAGRQFWLASEVGHLLPRRRRYHDTVSAEELAALLFVSVNSVYRWVRDGTLPAPLHFRGRSRWSRRNVEHHLAALPR